MQRLSNLTYRRVDCVVSIEEDPLTPDALEDLLARHKPSMVLGQNEQQVKRDALELDGAALATKLVRAPIELEIRESANIFEHLDPTDGHTDSSSLAA